MKVGNLKVYIFLFVLLFAKISSVVAIDRIETVPLVNLEELSPTFEEDKDALEKTEEQLKIPALRLIESDESKPPLRVFEEAD